MDPLMSISKELGGGINIVRTSIGLSIGSENEV